MSVKTNTRSGGISLFAVLGIIFVILKLTGNISWSWWWVICPFWGGFAIVGIILLGVLVMVGIVAFIEYYKDKITNGR